jgi:hypothetical protein
MHTYQIPATVFDNSGKLVTGATWTASDMTKVMLDTTWMETTANCSEALSGVMITTAGAGNVTITATSGSDCGSSNLTITQYDPSLYDIGKTRYTLPTSMEDPTMNRLACTDCHGPTATMGQFGMVSHTPEQTGGFSDSDLVQIFEHAMVPPNGYYDNSVYPYSLWQNFHHWNMQGQEEQGILSYLRALPPVCQKGHPNFQMGSGTDAGSSSSSGDAASE